MGGYKFGLEKKKRGTKASTSGKDIGGGEKGEYPLASWRGRGGGRPRALPRKGEIKGKAARIERKKKNSKGRNPSSDWREKGFRVEISRARRETPSEKAYWSQRKKKI